MKRTGGRVLDYEDFYTSKITLTNSPILQYYDDKSGEEEEEEISEDKKKEKNERERERVRKVNY